MNQNSLPTDLDFLKGDENNNYISQNLNELNQEVYYHQGFGLQENKLQTGLDTLLKNSDEEDDDYKTLYENLKIKNYESNETHREVNLRHSNWSAFEDEKLLAITENSENKDWNKIAALFEDKTPVQCFYRWSKVIKPLITSKMWTKEEDLALSQLVKKFGPTKWTEISRKMKKKTRKECMNRWNFHLSGKKQLRTVWLPSEELKLVLIVKKYGTYWSKIAKLFEDKDEYSTKNKFYSLMRKTANLKIHQSTPKNEKTINVFSLKLNELIVYLDDAIEMLKSEQSIPNSFENEINKILDNETTFSVIGEKLDKLNMQAYMEGGKIEDFVETSLSKKEEKEKESPKEKSKSKNHLVLKNNLTIKNMICEEAKSIDVNYQKQDNNLINTQVSSLHSNSIPSIHTLQNLDKENQKQQESDSSHKQFKHDSSHNLLSTEQILTHSIQKNEEGKYLLCKHCKNILKEHIKKKIVNKLIEKNLSSTGITYPAINYYGVNINASSQQNDIDSILKNMKSSMNYVTYNYN